MKLRRGIYELITNLISLIVAIGIGWYLNEYHWFETGEVLIIGLLFYFVTKIYLHIAIDPEDKKQHGN